MRRVLLTLVAALLVGTVLIVGCVAGGRISRPLRYELPNQYEGWVLIQYSSPNCEPMKPDGLGEVLLVPEGGRACTSSAPRAGWHSVQYSARTADGFRSLDVTLITVKSSQPRCFREEFYVRKPDQDSIPPEPPDWGFCEGSRPAPQGLSASTSLWGISSNRA